MAPAPLHRLPHTRQPSPGMGSFVVGVLAWRRTQRIQLLFGCPQSNVHGCLGSFPGSRDCHDSKFLRCLHKREFPASSNFGQKKVSLQHLHCLQKKTKKKPRNEVMANLFMIRCQGVICWKKNGTPISFVVCFHPCIRETRHVPCRRLSR